MFYLIEPYNAHQKPPKKKHWMELAEEEELYNRIARETDARNKIMEQSLKEQAIHQQFMLREANALSSQQVQDGQYAVGPAGAGGVPLFSYFQNSTETVDFSISPTTADGPVTVTFTNLTPSPDGDTYLWDFGSGSLTSTLQNPPPLLYTQTGSAGLYAIIDWVDAAAVQEIKDGKYLYLSPSINFSAVDEKSGGDIGAELLSLALTNTPFLKGMESITIEEVSNSSYLNGKDNKMMYKNKDEVAMAEEVDSEESQSEEKESMDMALSPEEQERATLLVDVMHVALVSALDAGLSVDSSTFSFELKEDGSVAVMGVDASGAELTHDVSVEEIMAALEEHDS